MRARSSIGSSRRLITVWLEVQALPGPPLTSQDLAGGNGRLWAATDLQAGYIHATIEIAKVMVIEGWPLEEAERLFNVPAIVDEKQPAAPSSPSRRGSDRSTRRRRPNPSH